MTIHIRKSVALLLALCMVFTLLPVAAAAEEVGNLLTNPGFEDGLTGWITHGNSGLASNYPFSGSGHYYTNGAASDYLYQTVTIPEGGKYILSAAMAGSGVLKLQDAEASVLVSATHHGQGYQIQECEPVALNEGDQVTVVLGYNSGDFYWSNGDDVSLALLDESAPVVHYISDWDWISAQAGYDTVRKNIGVEGKTISLIVDDDGTRKTFTKGLGAHAASEIVYDIAGKGVVRFQAYAGVNNTSGACGFGVYTDLSESPLWSAECVYGSEKAAYVDVEIPSEATRLILRTDDGGNGVNYDHSTWADPIVIINTTADQVELDVGELQVAPGTSRKIFATAYTDGEAVGTVIRWESSDEDVATVRSGVVTGLSEGTATVTASVTTPEGGTVTASCLVTVGNEVREDAVQAVIDMIAAMEDVAAARRAYELLTDAEQALVTNYADLEAAELEQIWQALELGDPAEGNLTLPLETGDGAALYWQTSDVAHLTENGIITPETDRDITATLTATMIDGENTYTRDFEIVIPADPGFVAREKMNILQIGDSNTEFGYLTQNMKDIVNDDFGDYGTGFVTLCTHITTWKAPKNISISQSGSWSQYDMAGDAQDGDNPDSLNGLSTEGYAGATIRVKFTGSAADIYYLSKPGAGQFTITVDGKDYGSFDANVAGDHLTQVAACDDLKYGKHEMLITVKTGSVVFHGVDVIVGQRDTRSTVHTWGNGTARAKDYAELNESVFASGLQAVNPNKVVIALGTNDHGYGSGNASGNVAIPAGDFEESLVTIIEMIQKALPGAEIWLMSTFETNDTFRPQSLPTLYTYWDTAFPNAARRTGVNYWDMGNWFGEYDSIKMQDTWHVNSKYGKIIMQELYDIMSGNPMTPEELAAAIDALIVTNGNQVAEVQDLIDRVDALSEEDQAIIGKERTDRLKEEKSLAQQMEDGIFTVVVRDQSSYGFDLDLTEKTTAGLTLHEGKVALEGWFDVDQEGAAEHFSQHLSGENSYTAVTSLYIDSAMKNDPNHYHMVYSTGDKGTALRVEREASGLRINIFVYTGSGWVAANSGNLDDEMLDRWLDVACVYDAEKNTIALWIDGEMIVQTGATGLKSTSHTLAVGYEPDDTLRKNNLKVSCLKIFGLALTEAELDSQVYLPETHEDVLLWYDYSKYNRTTNALDDADQVKALIDAIDMENITLDSEEAIVAAREAYEVLPDFTKALVDNIEKLVFAEKRLAELKEQAAQALEQARSSASYRIYELCTSYPFCYGSADVGNAAADALRTVTSLEQIEAIMAPVEEFFADICQVEKFPDVDEHAWYHAPVDFAVGMGYMKGDAVGTFRPEESITRAEMAQILYNIEEHPAYDTDITFSDVEQDNPAHWFYDAVMWAASQGYVKGDLEGTYRPEDKITREEMITIIWRYMGAESIGDAELTFADKADASDWAVQPIAWGVANGVVRGNPDNTFAPKDSTQRCQIAQVMMNLFG